MKRASRQQSRGRLSRVQDNVPAAGLRLPFDVSGGVRRHSRTVTALLAGAMIFSLQWDARPGEPVVRVGDRFPDLRTLAVEGDLPATLVGKVVVVDFWASWCGPCKESFSVLEELNLRFGKQGLVILAVNVDESRAAMGEFLKEHPVTFNVVRDSKKQLVRAINIQSMPSSYVLDSTGRVRAIYQGFHSAETRRKYIQEIRELLKPTTVEAAKSDK